MHDHLILAIFAALGLIALCLGYIIREANNVEQATYDALRDPHMGELGDSPIFEQLCLERLDAELDADR